jgi:hypothetical protein
MTLYYCCYYRGKKIEILVPLRELVYGRGQRKNVW